jgi:polygalacturonase
MSSRSPIPPGPGRRQLVRGLAAGGVGLASGWGWPTSARAAAAGGVYDVTRFGARGDGKTLNTKAIQRAIDTCNKAGGGTVLVPPGNFLTGALFLRSHLRLEISSGATLLGSPRFEDYPAMTSRSDGLERKSYASLLTGESLENVVITGGGVLDGQGPPWWKAYDVVRTMRNERKLPREAENPEGAPLKWYRPRVINLIRCQGVALRDLTIRESPYWTVHLVYCQDVTVDGLTITTLQASNIDGIIIDSCKQVRVANCSIGAGSDSIALKSGYNEEGRRIGIPCDDVVISNCHFVNSIGAGISIGSETAGGIRNVAIHNCTIERCRYGVHIRSPRGRGGVVERVRMSNLMFDKIDDAALVVSHFYDSVRMDALFGDRAASDNPETDRTRKLPLGEGTPTLQDIDFSDLTVGGSPRLALAVIEGLPERYIRGLSIRDLVAPQARAGVLLARAAQAHIAGLRMNPTDGPAIAARDVERLHIQGLICPKPGPKVPIIRLESAAGVFVHGCEIGPGATEFVRAEGKANRDLDVSGNNLPAGLKR